LAQIPALLACMHNSHNAAFALLDHPRCKSWWTPEKLETSYNGATILQFAMVIIQTIIFTEFFRIMAVLCS
jgi:heme A synthase